MALRTALMASDRTRGCPHVSFVQQYESCQKRNRRSVLDRGTLDALETCALFPVPPRHSASVAASVTSLASTRSVQDRSIYQGAVPGCLGVPQRAQARIPD